MTTPIAIVGMEGRFPGASSLDEYWDLLVSGRSGISRVPEERWGSNAADQPWDSAGLIADADAFDADFFGISPAEAEAMDPQQRVVLEAVWRAIESSGESPHRLNGRNVGVFVGVMGSEWGHLTLTEPEQMTAQLGTGNGYCMIANRVSYTLGLTGPSFAVDSACSSSLVALHLACSAIRNGDCGEAIVVGVNIIMTSALGRFYAAAGLAARDGECKPFNSDADGIVRGEAVVALHLKKLDDAELARQRIRAVIAGSAVGQDGRSNGLTAPNRFAQGEVMRRALRNANLGPADVVAVECHGTGTVLGDMIEANALGDVYGGTDRKVPLLIGSVKGNIGHVEGAAGVAGLVKMVLALEHRVLPPSRYAHGENPALKLRDKRLSLARKAERMRGRDVAVGVSSFGLGGTNVHVLLRSGQPAQHPRSDDQQLGPLVVTIGAPDVKSANRNAALLAETLGTLPAQLVASAARATRVVNTGGKERLAVTGSDQGALVARLRAAHLGEEGHGVVRTRRGDARSRAKAAFVFAGQGTEHRGMSRRLSEESPIFARHLANIDAHLTEELGESLVSLMHANAECLVTDPLYIQPAVFAHELALAKTLRECGVEPDWVGGHSIGELAAAAFTGAIELDAAARMIVARGRLTGTLPASTGMLTIRVANANAMFDGVLGSLPDGIEVAAWNSATQLVVGGDREHLIAYGRELDAQGLHTALLASTRAFHTSAVEPIVETFRRELSRVSIAGIADRPFYSSRFGRFLTDDDRLDVDYWTGHLRDPVTFAPLMESAPRTDLVFEISPRRALVSLLSTGVLAAAPIISVTPVPDSGASDLLTALSVAHVEGVEVTWPGDADHAVSPGRGYGFDRTNRYWRRHSAPRTGVEAIAGTAKCTALTSDETPITEVAYGPLLGWVLQTVRRIGGYDATRVAPSSSLADELYFDSVMVVQFCAAAETDLKIAIDLPAFVERIDSPADIDRYLKTHFADAVNEWANAQSASAAA